MLLSDDMIRVMREEGIFLVQQAILASASCACLNETTQSGRYPLGHGRRSLRA